MVEKNKKFEKTTWFTNTNFQRIKTTNRKISINHLIFKK